MLQRKMRFTLATTVAASATAGVLWAIGPTAFAHGDSVHAASARGSVSAQGPALDDPVDLTDFAVGTVDLPPSTGGEVTMEDIYDALRAQAPRSQEPNQIGTVGPPAGLVRACRDSITADSACGVVLAMEDGSLKPGSYSDKELVAAVAAAGYEWTPAS